MLKETVTRPMRRRRRRVLATLLTASLAMAACDPQTPDPNEEQPVEEESENAEEPAADEPAADEPAEDAEPAEDEPTEDDTTEDADEVGDATDEDEAEDEPDLVAVDVTVTIDPSTGPAGENARITVTGAPNSPVTLTINGVGQVAGTTDANGNYTFDTTFNGNDGDQIPVEAEVGIGADTRSGSATYTIDNPESAAGCTSEDVTAEQFHDTGELSPDLILANALSAILLAAIGDCTFPDGSLGVAIADENDSGTIDDGDAFFIAPQPFDGGQAALGIDRGGPYFIGIVPPGTDLTPMLGMPFDGPMPNDDGWVFFAEMPEVVVQVLERSPDNPVPARYDVDFGDDLMLPIP